MSATAHFQSIKPAILTELQQAKTKVEIAVAWFTDQELFAALLSKLQQQVAVSLLIRNDYVNNRDQSLPWQQFIDAGGQLYFSHTADALHHKFCLIDNRILLSGSYNWTYMAERRNQENCVFTTESTLLKQFQQEYQRLTTTLTPETQPARVVRPNEPEMAYLATYATADQALQTTPPSTATPSSQPKTNMGMLFEQAHKAALEMRYAEAVTLFNRILAINPTDGLSWADLALCFLHQEKYSDSIDACRQAIKTGRTNASVYETLGQAYTSTGQFTLAISSFDESIKLRPWSSVPLYCKWLTYEMSERFKEADACKSKILYVTSEGLENPHPEQNAVDVLFHHLHIAGTLTNKTAKQKAGSDAQNVYNSLPDDQKDRHFQQLIDKLK